MANIEIVVDLAKAFCLGYNLEMSVLYGWTDQLFFILHFLLQEILITMESQRSDQPGADSQAYYVIDGIWGFVPQ